MDQQIRMAMLAVMAGDKRVMPFLFALNGSKFKGYVLHFLLTKGIVGAALYDFIERRFNGDPVIAAHVLTLETADSLNRLM